MKLIKLEKIITIILMIILFLILFSTPLTIWLAKKAEKQKLLSQTVQSQIIQPSIAQSLVETAQITQPNDVANSQTTNATINTQTTENVDVFI